MTKEIRNPKKEIRPVLRSTRGCRGASIRGRALIGKSDLGTDTAEGGRKSETRRPKLHEPAGTETTDSGGRSMGDSDFVIRASFGFRRSDFGFSSVARSLLRHLY